MSLAIARIDVLLVENEAADSKYVHDALRAHSEYHVVCLSGMEAALDFLRATPVDVVLIDLSLRNSRDADALAATYELVPDVPVIVLTSVADEETISSVLGSGVQDYLVKGEFTAGEMERAIRYAIERKRNERALRETELRLQTIVRNAPVIIWSADRNAIVTFSDGKGLKEFGFIPGECVGMNILEAYKAYPEIIDDVRRALSGEDVSATREVDGVSTHTRYTPLLTGSGDIVGFNAVAVIFTEQLEAQREVVRQRELLQAQASRLEMIAGITASVVGEESLEDIGNLAVSRVRDVFMTDMCVLRVLSSEDELELLACSGIERDRLMKCIPANWGLSLEMVGKRRPVTITNCREHPITSTLFQPDNPLAPDFMSFAGAPLLVGDRAIGVLGIYMRTEVRQFNDIDLEHLQIVANHIAVAIHNDQLLREANTRSSQLEKEIHERTRVESALRESEHRFRRVVESNMLGIYFAAPDGTIVDANEAFLSMTRYTHEDIRNGALNWREITAPDCSAADERALEQIKSGGMCQPFEKAYLRKDGSRAPVIVGAATLDAENAGGVVFVLDISERKDAETRIRMHIDRLNALRTIDMAISASLDLRVTLNVLLEQVVENLKVDAASVLLLNRHDQMLTFAAGRGLDSDVLRHTRLRIGEGYAGRAAISRSIIAIEDLNSESTAFKESIHFRNEGFVAYYAIPLLAKGQVEGVLEIFSRQQLSPTKDWLEFLEALSGQAAIAINNAELFSELERSNVQLSLAYDTTLEGWSRALDLRDRETEGHTRRVTEMSERLARLMGLRDDQIIHIRRGSLLHDIGKMGIPDSILHKPGPLTDEEWVTMKKHPTYAYELLSPIDFLRPALDIPYCHHEKWDGSGYPRRLRGEQIPLAARIFAVVDVWDALTSDRPYRKAWEPARVKKHVQDLCGTHFEGRIVEAFLSLDF